MLSANSVAYRPTSIITCLFLITMHDVGAFHLLSDYPGSFSLSVQCQGYGFARQCQCWTPLVSVSCPVISFFQSIPFRPVSTFFLLIFHWCHRGMPSGTSLSSGTGRSLSEVHIDSSARWSDQCLTHVDGPTAILTLLSSLCNSALVSYVEWGSLMSVRNMLGSPKSHDIASVQPIYHIHVHALPLQSAHLGCAE